jgi:hypothetical protein
VSDTSDPVRLKKLKGLADASCTICQRPPLELGWYFKARAISFTDHSLFFTVNSLKTLKAFAKDFTVIPDALLAIGAISQ